MKIVKTRDSATSSLRKLGINSRDYNLFIKKTDVGFEVNIEAALQKAQPTVQDVKPSPVKEPIISRTAVVETKTKRETISSMAERLLIEGKTNADVWAAIKSKFNLKDDKKHYPSWFRSRLRRNGKLPKREKKS